MHNIGLPAVYNCVDDACLYPPGLAPGTCSFSLCHFNNFHLYTTSNISPRVLFLDNV